MSKIDSILSSFAPITLEEMSGIKLMNRIDTKFVTTRERVEQLLLMARQEYYAQQTDGQRLSGYSTTYFDTYDYNMFYVHQTGHTGRQKLRFRTYDSSGLQFMEVKTKNNHGRTKKKRMAVEDMSMASALAIAVGIAIQNIPEGAIISMPMRAAGNSRWRSFVLGSLSGAVEPVGALAVLLLASMLTTILPYMLAFAAGAMCYVVVEELIPEASSGKHSNLSTIGFAIGFVLMMVLDVVMG